MDYTTLITSEHNKQPKFMALIDAVVNGIGATADVLLSMPAAFDLDNAVGNQLDIDGEWIGQARVVTQVLTVGFFGFADDPAAATFGELSNPSIGGRFYELGEAFATTSVLGDPEYRLVLRARIVRNQSDGTTGDLLAGLGFLFGAAAVVTDPGNLSVTITIPSADVTATQKSLLTTFDLLPRPAGVAYNIVYS
jgi:hypothetical protein